MNSLSLVDKMSVEIFIIVKHTSLLWIGLKNWKTLFMSRIYNFINFEIVRISQFQANIISSTVVEHSSRNRKLEGSNHATGTGIGREGGKNT